MMVGSSSGDGVMMRGGTSGGAVYAIERMGPREKRLQMKAETAESAYPSTIERSRHAPIAPLPPIPAPTPNTLRTGFDVYLKAKMAAEREAAAGGAAPKPAGVLDTHKGVRAQHKQGTKVVWRGVQLT